MPLFALLLSLAGPVAAACPDDAGFKKLASFEHLYLGETHGTEEVPQLVQCLVQSAIAARAKAVPHRPSSSTGRSPQRSVSRPQGSSLSAMPRPISPSARPSVCVSSW